MSKANQKFVQADEAVSPVIGVILMVAITVVLAAVVFVLVSNLSKGGQKAPDVAFATDETRDRITIVTAAPDLNWDDFTVKATRTVVFKLNSDATTTDSTYGSSYTAVGGTADFNAGDFLDFCGGASTGAINDPTTFQIRHVDSNTVVYETTLQSINAC